MARHDHGQFRVFVLATKGLLFASSPFIAFGYGTKFFEMASGVVISSRVGSFLTGVTLFLPVCWLSKRYARKPWQFVCTFEHELTHAVVGLPFLFLPLSMSVTAGNGGHVRQRWIGPSWLSPLYGFGRLLSGLAPYFLPIVSYLLIVCSFFLKRPQPIWLDVILGFATTFHVVSIWAETGYRQPDIREAGLIFSTVFLPVANLVACGGVLAYVTGGAKGCTQYFVGGFTQSVAGLWSLLSRILLM